MHISFTNTKSKGKSPKKAKVGIKGDIKRFLPGIAVGTVLTFASVLAFSMLYLKINTPEKLLFYAVYVPLIFAAFMCGYICQKRVKGRGITVGAVAGAVLALLTAAFILILGGEKLTAAFLITPAIQLFSAVLGGITAANQKKRY